MAPRLARKAGSSARANRKLPVRLTLSVCCQSESETLLCRSAYEDSRGANQPFDPHRAILRSRLAARAVSGSVTSPTEGTAPSSSAIASAWSGLRTTATTDPLVVSRRAVANPMPDAPPVTTYTSVISHPYLLCEMSVTIAFRCRQRVERFSNRVGEERRPTQAVGHELVFLRDSGPSGQA